MDQNNLLILIVDDTSKNIQVLGTILRGEGYKISVAQNGTQALESVKLDPPDLILLDVMMPGMDGFETCEHLKRSDKTRDIPVIFLTAKTETEDIIKGFECGAVDYVTKPFNPPELLVRVDAHLTNRILHKEIERKNTLLKHELELAQQLFKEACDRIDGPLLGNSNAIRAVRQAIKEYSKNARPVLLIGPPGAGDEAIARAIHRESGRRGPAFVYINCHEYQSLRSTRPIVFRHQQTEPLSESVIDIFGLADGGTLYLDGVQQLSDELQDQLQRSLESFTSEGSVGEVPTPNVKVIAYTSSVSHDPQTERSIDTQLYRQLSGQTLMIPSVRERSDDIPVLVDYFVRQYARRLGKIIERVSEESMKRVMNFSWPGNIRELQNVLEHVVAAAAGSVLEINEEFLAEGQRVDRYRLIDKLGAGGMGEVWKARHQLLARPAALKLIRTDRLSDAEQRSIALKRFEREAQITARLKSPNTIKIFDYGVTETGAFYIVMELLPGMDLEKMVCRLGPMKAERVVMLLQQACRSLMEAHDMGLVHRDIKPQNLFICKLGPEYDFLKVLDFGIVKTCDEEEDMVLTGQDTMPGSAVTIAPEIIKGDEQIDPRSDIYSLGCVAYWMLTGKNVFNAPNAMKMLFNHLQTPARPPSEATNMTIPGELDQIVLKCLEKDPADRPQSMAELWTELAAVEFEKSWSQQRAQQWWNDFVPEISSGDGTDTVFPPETL